MEDVKENVEETTEEETRNLTLYDSQQTLMWKLEETDDPKLVEAIGKALAAIHDTETNEINLADKLALAADELELKQKELDISVENQDKMLKMKEKELKVTKFAAIVGLGSALLGGVFKIIGIYSQGHQAQEYLQESARIEKEDEVIIKSNKHMIPPLFTKNN